MSAKRPVPFLRQVVPVRKKVGAAPLQFMASLPGHTLGSGAAADGTGCFCRTGLEHWGGQTVAVFPWGQQGVGWSSCRLTGEFVTQTFLEGEMAATNDSSTANHGHGPVLIPGVQMSISFPV